MPSINDCPQSTELLLFSGDERSELIDEIQKVTKVRPGETLANIALTQSTYALGSHRLAVIAKNIPDLKSKLNRVVELLRNSERTQLQMRSGIYYAETRSTEAIGKTAFLFPGYGSCYSGMLADLCSHFPGVREWVNWLDQTLEEVEGSLPSQLLFLPPAVLTNEEQQIITQCLFGMNGGAQAGLTASLALYELLQDLGVLCDAMVGHSNGENTALLASGTIRYEGKEQLFEIMQRVTQDYRDAESIDSSPKGGFLAVSAVDNDLLTALINTPSRPLHLAMDNCPNQVVLFGSEINIEQASQEIAQAGGICVPLPFDHAYHTPLYEEKAKDLRIIYDDLDMREGNTDIYSCATGQVFPNQPEAIRALAVKQWSSPVKFRQTIENLYNQGFRTFVEVGPSNSLTSFVDDILRGRNYLAVASDKKNQSSLEQIQRLAAQLYVRGVPIKMDVFFRDRSLTEVDPVVASFNPQRQVENSLGVSSPSLSASARLSILQSHYDLMEQFLASQARVMSTLFASSASNNRVEEHSGSFGMRSVPQRHQDSWPLLGEIIEQTSARLYAKRSFDLKRDPFLYDHSLGRKVSNHHPELSPLPVVPFTVSMEILSEAASRLLEGRKFVIGITNVRSYRWLALDQGNLEIGVLAQLQPERDEGVSDVHVQILQLGIPSSDQHQLAFEGDVRLADKFPESPPPLPIHLEPLVSSQVSATEFYQYYAFHGPRFQSIKNLKKFDGQGIEADLLVVALDDFFSVAPNPKFQIPAHLLDCTGQLVGYWLIIQSVRDFGVFPFYAKAFHQYATPLAQGSKILCRGLVQMTDRGTPEATFDFLDDSERVIARLEGLQMRNYKSEYIPRFFQPRTANTYFSEAWMQEEIGLVCRRIDSIGQFLQESEGIWKRVLAHLTLSAKEREFWYSLPEKSPRRVNWLLGRVAAKDAMRQWAQDIFNLELAPVDLEILATQLSKPFVKCPYLESRGSLPDISISHSGDCAVAVVADTNMRLGIDIESLDKHNIGDWLCRAFTEQELEFVPQGDTRTLLALWCAKEAAAKALGIGLGGTPLQWRIVNCSHDQRKVIVTYEGNFLDVKLWYQDMEVLAVCQTPVLIV